MSSRTVSVVLKAQVDNYRDNMRKAEQHTRDVERAARSATEQLRVHHESLTRLGTGMAAVGAAAAVGLGVAVKAASEYGAKMAQLQSLSHASQAEMGRLSDAAMKQGAAFGYSASQVADAQTELAKAGVTVKDQLGGALSGALALAAAGQIDVAEATSVAVTAMTDFKLSASDIPHVADILASGADKSTASVSSIGQALQQSGLVASQFGLSVDDTVGTLTAFAQAGLQGSDAGTSLKSMLLALATPSQQAAAEMKKVGISAYDAGGNFVGVTGLADQLHTKLAGLTPAARQSAEGIIFGSDAIRSAGVLYDLGGKKLQGFIDANNEAGFASAQAGGKLNSLTGDVQKLSAAFETDLIKAGQAADGPLRGLAKTATNLVAAFGEIPGPVLSVGMAATGLVATVGLVGGAFLIAVPKIAAFRRGLDELKVSGSQAGRVFGKGAGLAVGIAGLAAGLAAVGQQGTATGQQIALAGEQIEKRWSGIDKLFGSAGSTMALGGSGLKASLDALGNGSFFSDSGAAKFLDSMTLGITHFADVYTANEGQLDAVGQQLAGLAKQDYGRAAASFSGLVSRFHLTGEETKNLLRTMPAYREELVHLARSAHVTASDQNLLNLAQGKGAVSAKVLVAAQHAAQSAAAKQAAGLAELSGQAAGATQNLDDLEKAIEGFGSATLDARGAQRRLEQSIDDATKTIKTNGRTLDVHTQAGRDNSAALDDIASSTTSAAAKTLHLTHNTDEAAKVMQHGRDAFIDAAVAAGKTRAQAGRLADQLGLIPKNVKTAVGVTGYDDTVGKVRTILAELTGLNGKTARVAVHIEADGSVTQVLSGAGGISVRRAAGGSIDGPGPKGVDSVPAMLAPGEHVLTARDVDALGGQAAVYRFRSAIAAGTVQGFADGGAVMRANRANQFGGIVDQSRNYDDASKLMARLLNTYAQERDRLRAATRSEARAQKAYDAIDGSKKNRAAKRAAKSRLDAAKETAAAIEKTHERTKQNYQDAKQDRAAAAAARADLRLGREDFVSAERRDPNRRSNDPMAYVDQLRQMSRDDNFSATRRKAMDKAANDTEQALVTLSAASEKAKSKLDDLQQSSTQLHDSIRDAVAGGFRASSGLSGAREASTRNVASGWITRNGIRMRTYSTVNTEASSGSFTAGGLASYYTQGASKARRFADDLGRLAKRGYPDALVAEVAGYGVEQGQPIIAALLAATGSQQAQISSGYTAIGSQAGRAGTIVAEDSYRDQIREAKANADAIQATITADGEKLRQLIARAFGLKGYATGTPSADAGVRWVGEDGPELVGFRGGEKVLSARDSARWVRGSGAGGTGGGGAPVVVQAAPFPDTITVQDLHGFTATMRVVARQEVSARNDEIAVRLIGAV